MSHLNCIPSYIGLASCNIVKSKLALVDPEGANFIARIFHRSRQQDTKIRYISQFRSWCLYCISIRRDPLKLPIDPSTAMYWISFRARTLNSIASIKQWLSMLCWLSEIGNSKKNDSRLPFTIKHILDYTKFK